MCETGKLEGRDVDVFDKPLDCETKEIAISECDKWPHQARAAADTNCGIKSAGTSFILATFGKTERSDWPSSVMAPVGTVLRPIGDA